MSGLLLFLGANATFLTVGLVLVVVLVLGLVVTPYLKKQGIVKEGDIQLTSSVLNIMMLVVAQIKFNSDKTRNEALIVIDVTKIAVEYVQKDMSAATVDERRNIAVIATIGSLRKLNIDVTDSIKNTIESTVQLLIK